MSYHSSSALAYKHLGPHLADAPPNDGAQSGYAPTVSLEERLSPPENDQFEVFEDSEGRLVFELKMPPAVSTPEKAPPPPARPSPTVANTSSELSAAPATNAKAGRILADMSLYTRVAQPVAPVRGILFDQKV